MSKNGISTLPFKRDRVIAKLDLAKVIREGKTVVYGELTTDVNNDTTIDITKQSIGTSVPQNGWSMTTAQGTGTITNVQDLGAVWRITYDGPAASQDAGSIVTIISTADVNAPSFRTRNEYDLDLLPTLPGIGSNDPADRVNNPNIGGLVLGRPWIEP